MMKKVTRITTFSLLFVLFAGYSVSLFAQTQDQQTVLEEDTEQTTPKTKRKGKKFKKQKAEEKTLLIEVTSNKRKENIQDVPASVSAFSGTELEDQLIEKLSDVTALVPNYTTGEQFGGFSYHSIRGQSNFSQYSNPVGIYIDDVPITAAGTWTSVNPSLFDVERIEVLRGAQGNLYGSNSAAGVINIITHKPQNYWEGKATAGFGNYDRRDFKASVGGPIVKDKLYAQVSGMYKKQNAFIYKDGQDPLNTSNSGMRFRLIYTPLENLELSLTSQINNLSEDDSAVVNLSKGYSDMYMMPSTKPDANKVFSNLNNFKIKYTHDVFELDSITSFTYSDYLARMNMALFDYTGDMIDAMIKKYGGSGCAACVGKDVSQNYDQKSYAVTQELRFVSTQNSPLKWLVGLFYSNANIKADQEVTLINEYSRDETLNDFSLFGNISYTFIKKITLGFGLRYDLDHRRLDYQNTLLEAGAYLGQTPVDIDTKNTTHSVSPKFTFDYKVHPRSLLYVSVARGVKNGMYVGEPTKADTAFLDPEYTWTYEGGLKTNFYNNRIFFNINGFYTQMTNVQVFYFVGTTHTYKNGGKAHSAGTELEFMAKPVRGLDISLTAGYLFSAFTKHEISTYDGNKLPFAPVYQVGLWLQYTSPIGIYLGFGLNVNGKTYYDDANKLSQKDYLLMKGKVGYISNHFSIDLWMENIAAEKYWAYLADFSGQTAGVPGSPRTFGMSVSGYF